MSKEIKNTVLSDEEILNFLSRFEFVFGVYLREIRQAKGKSIRQLAKAVSITPTYLSDIEKGNNKPPDKVLLKKIISELKIEKTTKLMNILFDLAAKERNDIPADIKEYLMNNKALLQIIRARAAKEMPEDEQIWTQLLEII